MSLEECKQKLEELLNIAQVELDEGDVLRLIIWLRRKIEWMEERIS